MNEEHLTHRMDRQLKKFLKYTPSPSVNIDSFKTSKQTNFIKMFAQLEQPIGNFSWRPEIVRRGITEPSK